MGEHRMSLGSLRSREGPFTRLPWVWSLPVLTLLSTLHTVTERGDLVAYGLAADDDRHPERRLYLSKSLSDWMDTDLSRVEIPGRAVSPLEQLVDFMDRFVGAPTMHINDFQQIKPAGEAVYEMKTTDVRVYGWFPARRIFIAVEGVLKRDSKIAGTVTAIRKRVTAFRSSLLLPQPDAARHEINVRELL